ncbi:phenylacetate--CoA ligase family protein [Aestuariirhabdus litorea]|uniref:Phenylacetate--CoA ligase family protein n=1 Tax=Aestuariirhabdus litorea TaxID=2528527 RepID=A0A3P3VLJ7_9GAMM|nr:phenylacetate--CoA ligase family protein [Aestuariirhabdus litorea]RRJ83284.1 phenylacetate--CoA ligase family protein [Aestuariirhabdus litorea]RWW93443.1 phenylacetate--CoA ligase family protein [Endozoicomonadaceae bacterium GTF-13]
MYTTLVSRLLFPLHESLKRHSSVARHRQLEASQWLSREELEQLQRDNLRRFLCRIAEQVPWYTELFARLGFDPAQEDSMAALRQLPLMDKAVIRAHREELIARDAGPLAPFNTGGSSGEPLRFLVGKARKSHDIAAKWRATRWWGVDIGDPELVVWGSPVELGSQDRLRLLRDRMLRSHLLPAFEMSEANVQRYVDTIVQRRPRMLFGYPSALALIASFAERRNVPLDRLGIKVVFVTSERLYENQKATIERVFGAPTANGYGGRDAGFIAHQCPAGGMHISAEDLVVEILDADGNPLPAGERGEVVVTHTATHEFPFVRYRTGDLASLSTACCPCGRGLPLLERIEGRTTDFLLARDGTVLHALSLIYILRDLEAVREFRIVQESLEEIRLQLVVGDEYDPALEQQIIAGVRQRLGEVRVVVERLEELPRERSGKFRYVSSKLAVDWSSAAQPLSGPL